MGASRRGYSCGDRTAELLRSLHTSNINVDTVFGVSLDQTLYHVGLKKKDAGHQLGEYVPLWREALDLLRAQEAATAP